MITFLILLCLAAIAAVIAFAIGGGLFVLFGDFIVCGAILWLLIKLFRRKK